MLVLDERLTRRVGALVLVALIAAVGFFALVYDRFEWHRRVRACVYFHEVGGLREGAGFVVAGRRVGRVESIAPVPRGIAGPLDGDPGIVVTVAIDAAAAARIRARAWPWSTPIDPRHPPADVFIASRGVVSERYLELAPAPPEAPPLRDGAMLLGADPATLDNVLQRTLDSMITLRRFGAEVRPELDALLLQLAQLAGHIDEHDLPQLFDAIGQAAEQYRRLRDGGLGGEPGLAHVRAVVGEARATIAELRGAVEQIGQRVDGLRAGLRQARDRLGGNGRALVAKLDEVASDLRGGLAKADGLLAQVDALEAHLAHGDGSIMKLIEDPEFFAEDLKELGKVIKRQPWKLLNTPGN